MQQQCSNAAVAVACKQGQGKAGQGRRVRERKTRYSKQAQAGIATQDRAALRKAPRILKQSSRKEN